MAATGIAAGLAVAAASAALAASPAAAQTPSNSDEALCRNAWEGAPAHDYCRVPSTPGLSAAGGQIYGLSAAGGQCILKVMCSIDARAGEETWTYGAAFAIFHSRLDTGRLDLCIASWPHSSAEPGTYNSYILNMKPGCGDGETDSATATSTGLPRP